MIVYEYEGDTGLEWWAAPDDLSELLPHKLDTLIEIPESLWASYQDAIRVVDGLTEAIGIVGRKLGDATTDLVVNGEHLVSHHGYSRPQMFRADLHLLMAEHDKLHTDGCPPTIPHVHGGRLD